MRDDNTIRVDGTFESLAETAAATDGAALREAAETWRRGGMTPSHFTTLFGPSPGAAACSSSGSSRSDRIARDQASAEAEHLALSQGNAPATLRGPGRHYRGGRRRMREGFDGIVRQEWRPSRRSAGRDDARGPAIITTAASVSRPLRA